jgi:hypothetical protein
VPEELDFTSVVGGGGFMAKERKAIPDDVASAVLVASAHTCCVCEERGKAIQIHHIDENPANNEPMNLAVLCLQCHHETQVTGGFSRKLSETDVCKYRDQWIDRVAKRRESADNAFISRTVGHQMLASGHQEAKQLQSAEYVKVERIEILQYIEQLPDILATAYESVRPGWRGNTIEIIRATYGISEVVKGIWLRLALAFDQDHFSKAGSEKYIEEFLQWRYKWQRALAEPDGPGKGGTIVGVLTANHVLSDLENMVVETVSAIQGLSMKVADWDIWLGRWNAARNSRK